jgi:peptide deformylase
MAIIPIRTVPDSVLREKARRVSRISNSIQKLAEDMLDTMRARQGAGLAAPQVGVLLRVVVIEIPEKPPIALINPEIVKCSDGRVLTEGCLSVPGYWGETKRSVSVTVKARNLDGKEIRLKAENDLFAQALEHEIDHLDGILYLDRLDSPDKLYLIEPTPED